MKENKANIVGTSKTIQRDRDMKLLKEKREKKEVKKSTNKGIGKNEKR